MSGSLNKRDLESLIPPETRKRIDSILHEVGGLSEVEKLYLYMKLPTTEYAPLESESGLPNREEFQNAVNWVQSHFEENVETSVPKQDVYDEYSNYCNKHGVKILGTTDFGRVMKSSFPGIKARRLGRRNMSKHYYGGLSKRSVINNDALPDVCPTLEDDVTTTARKTDELTRASGALVCEWANKMLQTPFSDVLQLAEHLVDHLMVSNKSLSAYTVIANSHGVRNSGLDAAAASRDMQLQLQKRMNTREGKKRNELLEQRVNSDTSMTVVNSDIKRPSRTSSAKNKMLLPKTSADGAQASALSHVTVTKAGALAPVPSNGGQIPVLVLQSAGQKTGAQAQAVVTSQTVRQTPTTTPVALSPMVPRTFVIHPGDSKLPGELVAASPAAVQHPGLRSPPPIIQTGGRPPQNAVLPGFKTAGPDSSAENSQDSWADELAEDTEWKVARAAPRSSSRSRVRTRPLGRTVSSLLKQQRGFGMQEDEPALVKDKRPVAELLRDKRNRMAHGMFYQFAGSQSTPVSPNTVSPKPGCYFPYPPVNASKRLLEGGKAHLDSKKRRHQSGDDVLLKTMAMSSMSNNQSMLRSLLNKQNPPKVTPAAAMSPDKVNSDFTTLTPLGNSIGLQTSSVLPANQQSAPQHVVGGASLGMVSGLSDVTVRSRHSSGQSQPDPFLGRSRHSSGQSQTGSTTGLSELLANEPTPQSNILSKLIDQHAYPAQNFQQGTQTYLPAQAPQYQRDVINSASSSPAPDPMLTGLPASLPVTPCVTPPPQQMTLGVKDDQSYMDYERQQRGDARAPGGQLTNFAPITTTDLMTSAPPEQRHMTSQVAGGSQLWSDVSTVDAGGSYGSGLSQLMGFQTAEQPQHPLLADLQLPDGLQQRDIQYAPPPAYQPVDGQYEHDTTGSALDVHQSGDVYQPGSMQPPNQSVGADPEELRDLLNSPEMKDIFNSSTAPALSDVTFRSQSLPAFPRAGTPDNLDDFLQ